MSEYEHGFTPRHLEHMRQTLDESVAYRQEMSRRAHMYAAQGSEAMAVQYAEEAELAAEHIAIIERQIGMLDSLHLE